jgi:hypothetical protein
MKVSSPSDVEGFGEQNSGQARTHSVGFKVVAHKSAKENPGVSTGVSSNQSV